MNFFLLLVLLSAPKPLDCTKALTLRLNDTVPCAEGVLFPPAWALEATRLKEVRIPELQNNLKFAKDKFGLKIKALQMELEIEQRFIVEQTRFLDTVLQAWESPPWWESPKLWVGVGFVMGAVSAIAITYAVNDGSSP